MMTTNKILHEGHRERLRKRFQVDPTSLQEIERLELLLTYCLPRRDVAGISRDLLSRFENLSNVISASKSELRQVPGIGESIISFFLLLNSLLNPNSNGEADMKQNKSSSQLDIFELIPPVKKADLQKTKPKKQAK